MSDNPNIAPSHEMNHAGINTLAELREDLEQQKRLFLEARCAYFPFTSCRFGINIDPCILGLTSSLSSASLGPSHLHVLEATLDVIVGLRKRSIMLLLHAQHKRVPKQTRIT